MLNTSVKRSTFVTALVVTGLVLGAVIGPVMASHSVRAAGSATASTTIVVAADGSGDYESIQAAVDEATAGDTVEVRPGTYEEQVVLDVTVTLVAPDGATLDGSTFGKESTGVEIQTGSDAEPVIDGFTITGYGDGFVADETTGAWSIRNTTIEHNENDGVVAGKTTDAWSIRDTVIRDHGDEGIDAENTAGPWTLRNVTITQSEDDGIDADGVQATAAWTIRDSVINQSRDDNLDIDDAPGSWTIRGTTITGATAGVQAINASGDWTITDSVILNNSKIGVNVMEASGDWTIRRSSFRYNRLAAIGGPATSGDWTIVDTTIRESSVGVQAEASSGDWTITNTSIRSLTVPRFYFKGQGTGVFAHEASGAWKVQNSNIVGASEHALNATGATQEGDATHNWWGDESGPSDGDCVGNADCGEALSEPPAVAEPPKAAFDPNQVTTATENDSPIPGFDAVAALLAVFLGLCLLVGRRHSGQ